MFDERWNLSGEPLNPLELVPHRAVYALPLSYNDRPNEEPFRETGQAGAHLENEEFLYQLSFKAALAQGLLGGRGDLWFGYTQSAWWQAYNRVESQPFREINYEPELIYTHRPTREVLGVQPQMVSVRLSHLSNGRGRALSRSFNRFGAGLLFDNGERALRLQAWYPLPADGDIDPSEVVEYFGRMQADWYQRFGDSTLHVMLRNNLSTSENRSAVSIGYSMPTASPYVYGYVEYRYGYGDGLIDYKTASDRISIGAMFVRWH